MTEHKFSTKKKVLWFIRNRPQWKSSAIAEVIGCAPRYVSSIRARFNRMQENESGRQQVSQ